MQKFIGIAFEALLLNKVRSALTMLGIIIGVLSVIVLVGLGQASQAYVTQQVQGLGSGLLVIMPGPPGGNLVTAGGMSAPSLTLADARALESITGVRYTAPSSVVNQVLQVGTTTAGAEVVGTTPEIRDITAITMGEGRFFTDQESRSGARVMVLGNGLAKDLFARSLEAPVGAKVSIGEFRYRVIGVMAKQKGAMDSMDRNALMPTRAFQATLRGGDFIDVIYLKADSEELLPFVTQQARQILRQRHGLRGDDEDDFNIQSQAEILAIVTTVTQTFTVLLAGIAAISLLVGGIGIMNIMLVSVTERTREIGVRKAVGAKRHHILTQFLIESASISLAGGLIGVTLGLAITFGITAATGLPFVVSPLAVAGGFFFSAAVGVFFGLYPAAKAARLDPVDALRYE